MLTAWNYWAIEIAGRLAKTLNTKIEPGELVVPPDRKMGDLAFSCFRLAKEKKISPTGLASMIAEKIELDGTEIASAEAVGPYVNFKLSVGDAVHRVVRDLEVSGEKYGTPEKVSPDQILLEYANPNTHKEIHIGHLRMIALGVAIYRIMKAYGYNVVPVSYINDVGSNVAKSLWFFVKQNTPNLKKLTLPAAKKLIAAVNTEDHNGRYLGAIYTEATKFLDENPGAKDDISYVQQQLETHAPAWEYLWRETRRWCLEEIVTIFDELGVSLERQYFESEVLDRSHEIVNELLAKKIAQESQGAIIVDLEDVKLGAFLIRKTDGNLLYAAKDLALAELKREEYPKHKENLLVVDSRQSLYFKQLFETLKRLGFIQRFEQVGFEIVTLKEGVMSSRKGNIVTYEAFRDTVLEYARHEVLERHRDWSEGQVVHTSWAVMRGGIRYAMLKPDSDKVIVFDLKQALSFDGATGPYCQYAVTRLGSILNKSKLKPAIEDELTRSFDHESEKQLALALAQYPTVLARAANERKPSVIAQWCFETAQSMNDFYRDVPVLESKGELLAGRLRLVAAARGALTRGLDLLGIPLPEEM